MAKQIKKKTIQERTLAQLNDRFCKRVADTHFTSGYGQIVSQGTRSAINVFEPRPYEINATPWFGDYWFFISIQFRSGKRNVVLPYASVSFFQDTGEMLKQLFRAEWDNYPEIEGYNHPQPHWHFTAQLSDITSFRGLEEAEEENEYNKLLGNSKSINLNRMHFAMAGEWLNDGNMFNSMDDEKTLVDWLISLFNHVREELWYKDN